MTKVITVETVDYGAESDAKRMTLQLKTLLQIEKTKRDVIQFMEAHGFEVGSVFNPRNRISKTAMTEMEQVVKECATFGLVEIEKDEDGDDLWVFG